MPPLRVVIADDHPYFRHGLARLLSRFEIEVVAEVSNGWGAIEAAEETSPDVVVLDLNMPLLPGPEVIRRLVERTPASRILVLSVSADEIDVTDAILAGAGGYVLKDGPPEDVVAGVRALAAGESLISPRIASMLLQRIRERELAKAGSQPLSHSDVELLRLVAEGKTEGVGRKVSAVLANLQAYAQTWAAERAARNGTL